MRAERERLHELRDYARAMPPSRALHRLGGKRTIRSLYPQTAWEVVQATPDSPAKFHAAKTCESRRGHHVSFKCFCAFSRGRLTLRAIAECAPGCEVESSAQASCRHGRYRVGFGTSAGVSASELPWLEARNEYTALYPALLGCRRTSRTLPTQPTDANAGAPSGFAPRACRLNEDQRHSRCCGNRCAASSCVDILVTATPPDRSIV
jgi:hypothetical protein